MTKTAHNLAKLRRAIWLALPRNKRTGKKRVVDLSIEVSEIALETGLHANTIRALVRKHGDELIPYARVEYSAGTHTPSGRGAFGRDAGNPAGYMPATVDIVRRRRPARQ